jgi:hypothetical protein
MFLVRTLPPSKRRRRRRNKLKRYPVFWMPRHPETGEIGTPRKFKLRLRRLVDLDVCSIRGKRRYRFERRDRRQLARATFSYSRTLRLREKTAFQLRRVKRRSRALHALRSNVMAALLRLQPVHGRPSTLPRLSVPSGAQTKLNGTHVVSGVHRIRRALVTTLLVARRAQKSRAMLLLRAELLRRIRA